MPTLHQAIQTIIEDSSPLRTKLDGLNQLIISAKAKYPTPEEYATKVEVIAIIMSFKQHLLDANKGDETITKKDLYSYDFHGALSLMKQNYPFQSKTDLVRFGFCEAFVETHDPLEMNSLDKHYQFLIEKVKSIYSSNQNLKLKWQQLAELHEFSSYIFFTPDYEWKRQNEYKIVLLTHLGGVHLQLRAKDPNFQAFPVLDKFLSEFKSWVKDQNIQSLEAMVKLGLCADYVKHHIAFEDSVTHITTLLGVYEPFAIEPQRRIKNSIV